MNEFAGGCQFCVLFHFALDPILYGFNVVVSSGFDFLDIFTVAQREIRNKAS